MCACVVYVRVSMCACLCVRVRVCPHLLPHQTLTAKQMPFEPGESVAVRLSAKEMMGRVCGYSDAGLCIGESSTILRLVVRLFLQSSPFLSFTCFEQCGSTMGRNITWS